VLVEPQTGPLTFLAAQETLPSLPVRALLPLLAAPLMQLAMLQQLLLATRPLLVPPPLRLAVLAMQLSPARVAPMAPGLLLSSLAAPLTPRSVLAHLRVAQTPSPALLTPLAALGP
jgi:hypothetical protein